MIVTTDIGNILYRDCKAFGIDIVPDGETLTGELKSERIVIHAKKQQPGTYWRKSFAEVNLCVPDSSENEANTIRLNELEREANKRFDDVEAPMTARPIVTPLILLVQKRTLL